MGRVILNWRHSIQQDILFVSPECVRVFCRICILCSRFRLTEILACERQRRVRYMNLKKSPNQCLEVGTVLNHHEKEWAGRACYEKRSKQSEGIRIYFKFQISLDWRARQHWAKTLWSLLKWTISWKLCLLCQFTISFFHHKSESEILTRLIFLFFHFLTFYYNNNYYYFLFFIFVAIRNLQQFISFFQYFPVLQPCGLSRFLEVVLGLL